MREKTEWVQCIKLCDRFMEIETAARFKPEIAELQKDCIDRLNDEE